MGLQAKAIDRIALREGPLDLALLVQRCKMNQMLPRFQRNLGLLGRASAKPDNA